MKKVFIYGFVVSIFALSGIALAETTNTQTILSSVQKPKSATFVLTANVTGFDTSTQKNVTVDLTGKGSFDMRNLSNRLISGNIKINTNLYEQKYPILFDFRVKKQDTFIKVSGLKNLLGEEYENKWVKFSQNQDIAEKILQANNSTKDPLLADKIYTISKELGAKNISGIPVNGYEFIFNKDAFVSEFAKIAQQNQQKSFSTQEIQDALKNIESITGTTWISKRSKFPVQTNMIISIKTNDSSWYNVTLKVNYSRFNMLTIVTVPKNFLDMDKKFGSPIPQPVTSTGTSPINGSIALSQCLKDKNVTWYGASWCPHCREQKALFHPSVADQNYVECSDTTNPGAQKQICIDKNITGYPTWIFGDGSRLEGTQQLSTVAEKAGCGIIVN